MRVVTVQWAFSMIKNQTLYRSDQENYVLFDEINKKVHKANVERFYENFVASTISQSA